MAVLKVSYGAKGYMGRYRVKTYFSVERNGESKELDIFSGNRYVLALYMLEHFKFTMKSSVSFEAEITDEEADLLKWLAGERGKSNIKYNDAYSLNGKTREEVVKFIKEYAVSKSLSLGKYGRK